MKQHLRGTPTTVVVVAGGATLLIALVDSLRFAYESDQAHVALETAATIIAAMVAGILYGRARQTRTTADILLFVGLAALALSNLGRLVAPAYDGDNDLAVWLPLVARLLAAGALAGAAFASSARVRSFGRALWSSLGVLAVAALVSFGLFASLGSDFSVGIDPDISPADTSTVRIDGSAGWLVAQGLVIVMFAAAAVGFGRRSVQRGDTLLGYLAASMLLVALARVHYVLFPSVYTDWVFTGDIVFFFAYVLMFVGALREIARNQEWATRAAILEERNRIARDLHDGLAQDLAFLSLQGQRLGAGHGGNGRQIAEVARDALAQSRAVIANLSLTDAPLGEATASLARALAVRHGIELELRVDETLEMRPKERDDVLRILSEAISNAVRHGHAGRLTVELARDTDFGLHLRVFDDGDGFDVDRVLDRGTGHGIRGMRERAERMGGRLELRSQRGIGTTVEVLL